MQRKNMALSQLAGLAAVDIWFDLYAFRRKSGVYADADGKIWKVRIAQSVRRKIGRQVFEVAGDVNAKRRSIVLSRTGNWPESLALLIGVFECISGSGGTFGRRLAALAAQ